MMQNNIMLTWGGVCMSTSQMIADACGVSRGTVDRALNNRGYVKTETKKLILAKAIEMGYSPNFLASSLKKGATKTIGIIVFDLYNPFFSFLVNHIEQVARQAGYSIYITLSEKKPDIELDCIKNMADHKVDGIIIDSVNHQEELDQLRLNIPIIAVGNKISDEYPFIGIDDFAAEKDALKFVHGKGYQRFLFVCTALSYAGQSNIWAQSERYRGFLAGIDELNIPSGHYEVYKTSQYMKNIKNYLNISKDKTAIICTSDSIAIPIMYALKEEGYNIPRDVGILGFDNINVTSYTEPRMSTVDHSLDLMGEHAVQSVIRAINKESDNLSCFVPYKIIDRQSI